MRSFHLYGKHCLNLTEYISKKKKVYFQNDVEPVRSKDLEVLKLVVELIMITL